MHPIAAHTHTRDLPAEDLGQHDLAEDEALRPIQVVDGDDGGSQRGVHL